MDENRLETWRSLMEKGTSQLGQAEYKKAEMYFLRSLKVANILDVPVIQAFNLRLLATAQIKQGKTEPAERGFREALRICEEISNVKGMSEALAGLASVAIENNHLEDAIVWYKKAIEVYPNTSPQLRLAMLYSDLGQVFSTLERWGEAQETYDLALERCHRYGYPKGEGELSVLTGEACFRQGDIQGARSYLIQACRIFGQIKEYRSLISALQYFAFMHFEQEEYEESRMALQRSLALQVRYALWDEVSESSYFLTKVLQELDFFEEAYYYMQLTLQLYKREDIGMPLRLLSMGKLLTLRQKYAEAKKYHQEAAIRFEYFNDSLRLGECYERLANLSEKLGEDEEAIRYHKESLRVLEGHNRVSFNVVYKLAEYYENQKNYREALRCYWQSLGIAREIGYETQAIEKAVQRVSRRVRKKRRSER